MLTVTNLTYRIGGRTIIEDSSINLMDGWKIGVVGVNGAGKSTLFKLIMGVLQPDGGEIKMNSRLSVGFVRQDIPETDTPLIDIVLQANEEQYRLMKASETETDPALLADIYQQLIEMDAYSAPSRAAILLTGLGFKEHQLQEPFSSFSGGWRMRVALAAALFVEPEVLLLDEPTNHLDLEAIMWLENYLSNYPHTLLIISHDRDLLNKCIDHVVHVDKAKLTLYTGNYDTFERERAARLGAQQKLHEKQVAARAHMQAFVDRFRAKASKARQAQSRLKALEKMDVVDAVIADRAVKFSFPQTEELAPPLISIKHADIGYSEGNPVLCNVYDSIDIDDRIALLGANGNGKSTLMKLIAGRLGVMDGEIVRSGKLRIGYFSQHQTDELDVDDTPVQAMTRLLSKKQSEVKESAVRARLGQFGFSKDLADNRIGDLSGGEKARLLFAFMSFDAPHLLLLDEPTNHLDMDAREALVQALNAYNGAIVIVSHDPSMVERVADRLWLVKDGACTKFDGDLDDYRQFIVQSKREERKQEKSRRDAGKAAQNTIVQKKPDISSVLKKIEKIERDMKKIEREKADLESQMAAPAFYSDMKASAPVQSRYDNAVKEFAALEQEWFQLQAEIEAA